MAKNPPYVRLADHMVHGLCVDIETGWGISGYDVQPFPEDADEKRFVRGKINNSVLEAASKAEYDVAHPASDDDDDGDAAQFVEAVKAVTARGGKQEHVIRQTEKSRTADIRAARAKASARAAGDDDDDADDDDDDDSPEADQARREALAAEQKEAGLDSDAKKAKDAKKKK